MNNVRKEIRDLITINEKIQSALLNGERLSDDEATLTRQCASELLETIPAPHATSLKKGGARLLSASVEGHEMEDPLTASEQPEVSRPSQSSPL